MTQPIHVRARKRAGALAVDGFFKGISRLGRYAPGANPQRHGVEVIRDVAYRATGMDEHRLDVYRPEDRDGPLPIVLYVHGGGFRMLDKDSHWLPALIFARRGYLVFNISYRLAPKHPFPGAVEDTIAAWLWVLREAKRYGGDLDRLVVAGESAGANLVTALTVATTFDLDDPIAAPAFEAGVVPKVSLPAMGMLQVSDPERFLRRRKLSSFIGDRLVEVTEAYLPEGRHHPLADPLLVLESDREPDRPLPPFHACVGTRDPILDDTRRLAHALSERGVAHKVSYWPGHLHAFHMFVFLKDARSCWREILAFTERHVA